jgi:hypothetical protein
MKRVFIGLLLVLLTGLLAACAGESTPEGAAEAVQNYLQAKVDGDVDAIRGLLCAEMESIAPREANTFASVEASLKDVACTAEVDGDTARVDCDGTILADYGQEELELELSNYRMVKEDGEWKWCGETE